MTLQLQQDFGINASILNQTLGFTADLRNIIFPSPRVTRPLAAPRTHQILLLSQACQDADVLTEAVSRDNHLCSSKPKVAACSEKGFTTSNPQFLPHAGKQLETQNLQKDPNRLHRFSKAGLSSSHHAFRKEDYILLVQCAGYRHRRVSAGVWTVRSLGRGQDGLCQEQHWLLQRNSAGYLQVF